MLFEALVMYVHLLSNASMDVFPNNKLGDFSTILSQPLTFDQHEYEVGLVSVLNIKNNI